MITPESLKSHSAKDLGRLAEKLGVAGWKAMKKDQLISAIVKAGKSKSKANSKRSAKSTVAKESPAKTMSAKRTSAKITSAKPTSTKPMTAKAIAAKPAVAKSIAGQAPRTSPINHAPAKGTIAKGAGKAVAKVAKVPAKPAKVKPTNPKILAKIQKANAERDSRKDVSRGPVNGHASKEANHAVVVEQRNGKTERDRLVLMVRDAYWLHACWEISRASVQRVQAAMAEQWHTARPVLRVMEVDAGATTSASERMVREIPIHGGVTNWYIDVQNPPRSFRVDIGYLGSNARFYGLVRSNVVSTPNPGGSDESDPHWTDVAQNFEKIYALSGGFSDDHATGDLQELFEERLRRPMRSATNTGFGVGAERALKRDRDFRFDVDAEMLIFGQTKPGSHVSIGGTPVKVKPDGSFAVRLAMPDKRQVLPMVARSGDGVEHRTIVLAVERNTKVMEPVVKESGES